MANISDIITPQYLAEFWAVDPRASEPYFLESKFPPRKKVGLNLDWIKGAQKAPARLSASAFDVDVIKRKRQGFETLQTKMQFFKNAMTIDEETRQELLMVNSAGYDSALRTVIARIFDDQASLLRDARATVEALRAEALTTGAIAIDDNGVARAIDYSIPSDNKISLSGTAKWDAPTTADPIKDIIDWQTQMQENGIELTELLMNRTTFNLLTKVDSIKNQMVAYAITSNNATLTPDMVNTVISRTTGMTIYIYDKGIKDADGTLEKFIPDNVVIAMPSGTLGYTYFGTTPEEADLMSRSRAVDSVTIVDTGVAITQDSNADPVWTRTKVSMVVMPSFEGADQVIIATVAGGD